VKGGEEVATSSPPNPLSETPGVADIKRLCHPHPSSFPLSALYPTANKPMDGTNQDGHRMP